MVKRIEKESEKKEQNKKGTLEENMTNAKPPDGVISYAVLPKQFCII